MFSIKFDLTKGIKWRYLWVLFHFFVISVFAYLVYILVLFDDLWLKFSAIILVGMSIYSLGTFGFVLLKGLLPNFSDWFRLGTFLSIELEAFFLLHELESNKTVEVFDSINLNSFYFFKSVIVVLVGLLALFLVDILLKGRHKKRFKKEEIPILLTHLRKGTFFLFSAILLVLDLYFVLTSLTGFGSTSTESAGQLDFIKQFIHIFASLNLALICVLYFFTKTTKFFKLYFISFLIVNVIIAVLSGMKESVIMLFMFLLIPYFLSGRNFKIKQVVLFILILILVFPFNKRYRKALEITENKAVALYLAFQNTDEKEDNSNKSAISSRFFIFSPLMYGVSIEQEWSHYKYMNRYVYAPFAWIVPGALLPGKPRNDFGRILYQEMRNTSVTTVSITPSTFGWVYLEGGYLFVFIVFLIFGFVLKYLDNLIRMDTLQGLLLYILLVPSLIKVESDIYFRIVGYFQILLCLAFLRFLIGDLKIRNENQ